MRKNVRPKSDVRRPDSLLAVHDHLSALARAGKIRPESRLLASDAIHAAEATEIPYAIEPAGYGGVVVQWCNDYDSLCAIFDGERDIVAASLVRSCEVQGDVTVTEMLRKITDNHLNEFASVYCDYASHRATSP